MRPKARLTDVLSAWGGGQILGPLPGGARSAPVLVEVAGRLCVARATETPEPGLRWLRHALEHAKRSGLAVPKMIPTRYGAFTAGGWRVETYLDGVSLSDRECARALRSAINRLHASGFRMPPRPGIPAHARGGHNTLIHGDLHVGNLLRLPSGQLALLDWAEARRDSPLYDLTALARMARQPVAPRHRLAHLAYEIETGWHTEPAYGRRMARRFWQLGRRP